MTDLQRRLAALGRYAGEPSGDYDDPTRKALAEWAGEYNLEGRLREDDQISNQLVVELRDVTPEIPRTLGRRRGRLLQEADQG